MCTRTHEKKEENGTRKKQTNTQNTHTPTPLSLSSAPSARSSGARCARVRLEGATQPPLEIRRRNRIRARLAPLLIQQRLTLPALPVQERSLRLIGLSADLRQIREHQRRSPNTAPSTAESREQVDRRGTRIGVGVTAQTC